MNKDTDGGLQPGRDPDDIDAAQAALNRMRDAAAARGEIRRRPPPRPGSAQKPARSPRGTRGFSQFHGTGRDPLGLGKVVGRLVAERGWSSPVAVGSVMAQWPAWWDRRSRPTAPLKVSRTPPCMFAPTPRPGQPSCGCSAAACWRNSAPNSATASSPASRCSDLPHRAGARASGRSTAAGPGTPTDSPGRRGGPRT